MQQAPLHPVSLRGPPQEPRRQRQGSARLPLPLGPLCWDLGSEGRARPPLDSAHSGRTKGPCFYQDGKENLPGLASSWPSPTTPTTITGRLHRQPAGSSASSGTQPRATLPPRRCSVSWVSTPLGHTGTPSPPPHNCQALEIQAMCTLDACPSPTPRGNFQQAGQEPSGNWARPPPALSLWNNEQQVSHAAPAGGEAPTSGQAHLRTASPRAALDSQTCLAGLVDRLHRPLTSQEEGLPQHPWAAQDRQPGEEAAGDPGWGGSAHRWSGGEGARTEGCWFPAQPSSSPITRPQLREGPRWQEVPQQPCLSRSPSRCPGQLGPHLLLGFPDGGLGGQGARFSRQSCPPRENPWVAMGVNTLGHGGCTPSHQHSTPKQGQEGPRVFVPSHPSSASELGVKCRHPSGRRPWRLVPQLDGRFPAHSQQAWGALEAGFVRREGWRAPQRRACLTPSRGHLEAAQGGLATRL